MMDRITVTHPILVRQYGDGVVLEFEDLEVLVPYRHAEALKRSLNESPVL